MLKKEIINIAIVGLGTIGKRHVMAIKKMDGIKVCGVVDLDLEAKFFCNSNNLPYFSNLEDLNNSISVDGVIISTPTIMHYKTSCLALKLGLDVLIEKPITASVIEAKEILDLAKKQNCKVLVGHQRRFYPLVLNTKQIIKEGKLGQVIGLSGIWGLRKDNEYFDPKWRQEITAGPVITNLIHEIDCLRYIFGEIETVSSFSTNALRNFKKEDVLTVNFKFKNGILGNFLITDAGSSPWSWETAIGENIHLPKLSENSIRIIGTEGSLEFPNLKLWSYDKKTNINNWKDKLIKNEIHYTELDPYISQINHFKDVIERKIEPITDAEDGMTTLKVALSILESADTNKTIKIQL
jgi:predicted dehydrogenase|tara:strand:- start:416 stop:1471 length:1056 start_codon:yes stop_codon:yes gene_type:complete